VALRGPAPVRYIEQDDVTLQVAAANGGIEPRLLAADGPEHRLRLSLAEGRELLRLLCNLLERHSELTGDEADGLVASPAIRSLKSASSQRLKARPANGRQSVSVRRTVRAAGSSGQPSSALAD
jgi:hypothetical protein